MSALSKVMKRLAENEIEHGQLLVTLQVLKSIGVKDAPDHAAPLAKALARVNGHRASETPSAPRHGRDVRMTRIIEWLSDGPRRPFESREVANGIGEPHRRDRIFGVLQNLTKRTRFHPKLVKKVGTKWLWIGDGAKATNADAPVKAPKKARTQKPGALRDAIVSYLKGRERPAPFTEIRDALQRAGVIAKNSMSGRGVSATLHTSLLPKGLAKTTPEGWVYTGPS